MKKWRYLIFFLLFPLYITACQGGENEEKETIPMVVPGTTIFDDQKNDLTVAAENESLQLSFRETAGQFEVMNKKDGSIYRSITSAPATPAENSLFEIYYLDSRDNFATMCSYTDAVAKGQYQIDKIENGLKINYTLGELDGNIFCPPAIPKERFEELAESIDGSFDKAKFKQSYYLPNFDKLPKEKSASLMEKYPDIKEKPLYVLTQEKLPESVKKEISRILMSIGYTPEEYEKEAGEAGGLTVNQNVAFNVNMYITLEGKKLRVRVPVNEIQEMNGGRIISISLLKNFAVPEFGETGQFILPDGSGSLMNFYNGKENLNPVQIPVYGVDRSNVLQEQIFQKEQAYLPIYGIQYTDKAVLAVISDGEAFTQLEAWPGSGNAHGYVSATFFIRQRAKSFLGSTTTDAEAFQLLQKKLYDGDLAMDFYFYDKSENTLPKIARSYAEILFGDLERKSEKSAIYLEFIGAVYEKKAEMAFGDAKLNAFTSVSEVQKILEDLSANKVGPMVVKLVGFGKKGMDSAGIESFQLNHMLGSQKELKELENFTKEQGIELYLDADPQYVYGDKWFDGFSKSKNAAYQITKLVGQDYPYSPATFEKQRYETPRYILNADSVDRLIRLNAESIKKFGDIGISLRDAGSDLNSDFHRTKAMDRQNTKKRLEQSLADTAKGQNILVNGANAFVLPFVSHTLRIQINKARFDIADQTVPFLQMVLAGRIGFSDTPVNISGNSDKFVTASLGTGAGYAYVLTGMPEESLRKTTRAEYYSTQYEVWKEDILEKAKRLEERNQCIKGEVTEYQLLAPNVFQMKYENGGWIVWNLSELSYSYGSTVVKPGSYLMGGE